MEYQERTIEEIIEDNMDYQEGLQDVSNTYADAYAYNNDDYSNFSN